MISSEDLDSFVERSDSVGHPGSPETQNFWKDIEYRVSTPVDESLDPFSDEYVRQQIAVYSEISGRKINQAENELCDFNLPEHVDAANPYAHQPPHVIGMHMSRISRAIERSGLELNEHILDMGCGWGLSSELFAFSGLKVTAVDINPKFVQLVSARAEKRGHDVRALQGMFEEIPGEDIFDAVAYYECLHHAVRPWVALSAARERLRPGGKLILAGEPINEMWRHWGVRLDPLSIYCIRKFGWFESGWSPTFIRMCIERSGFVIRSCRDEGAPIGWIILAEYAHEK